VAVVRFPWNNTEVSMSLHVVMDMMCRIDRRIVPQRWPSEGVDVYTSYVELSAELLGDAWVVGRVTMAEMAGGPRRAEVATERFPREIWRAPGSEDGEYAITLDPRGQLHLN